MVLVWPLIMFVICLLNLSNKDKIEVICMNAAKLKLDLKGKIVVSIFLLSLFSCSYKDIYDEYRIDLSLNREMYEKIGVAFNEQKIIRSITKLGENEFNVDGSIFRILKDPAAKTDSNNAKIKINYKKDTTSLKEAFGLSLSEFLKWIAFLERYKVVTLYKASGVIKFVFHGGFLGEDSGLMYILDDNEDVSWTNPGYYYRLEKVDERWYLYTDM